MNTKQEKRLEKYIPKYHERKYIKFLMPYELKKELGKFFPDEEVPIRTVRSDAHGKVEKFFSFGGAGWEFCNDEYYYTLDFIEISSDEWSNAYKNLRKAYEKQKKEFEEKNPIWNKLKALDSIEVKKTLSETELNNMKQLYEEQLSKDPDYKVLENLTLDLCAIDTKVKQDRKEGQKEERNAKKNKLRKLRNEYRSGVIKKAIPDVKERLALRKIMHKSVEGGK